MKLGRSKEVEAQVKWVQEGRSVGLANVSLLDSLRRKQGLSVHRPDLMAKPQS